MLLGVCILLWLFLLLVGSEYPSAKLTRAPVKVHRVFRNITKLPKPGSKPVVLLDLMPSPLLRRGPVPNILDLGEAKPDEENVAGEVIDAKDHPDAKGKIDDNAAREENSGEAFVVHEKDVFPVGTKVKSSRLKSTKEEDPDESFHQLPEHQKELPEEKYGAYNNWRNLTLKEINSLSELGRRMFLNEKVGQEQNKKYTIHMWKYKKYIEKRLLKTDAKQPVDPFEHCSVSNCRITSEDKDLAAADVVLFHLHRISGPPEKVPRTPGQLWVWLSDESPYNVFMVSKDRNLSHYQNYFNWSMTYRMDADIPVPYGRTVPLPKDQYHDTVEDYFKLKPKDIAILGSNCGGINGRYKYIEEMKKYVSVDMYGRCGTLKCSGHFHNDCPALNSYKIYLAFENGNCDQYITEKVRQS